MVGLRAMDDGIRREYWDELTALWSAAVPWALLWEPPEVAPVSTSCMGWSDAVLSLDSFATWSVRPARSGDCISLCGCLCWDVVDGSKMWIAGRRAKRGKVRVRRGEEGTYCQWRSPGEYVLALFDDDKMPLLSSSEDNVDDMTYLSWVGRHDW